jgi:hypothetical protein
MKHRVITNLFMSNLGGLNLRQLPNGATRVIPLLTASAVLNHSRSLASADLLAAFVALGERAHSLRHAEILRQVGQEIQDLALPRRLSSIGKYYEALSINRQGPKAYGESNRLLVEVAEEAPQTFRAKAMVALGTNFSTAGSGDVATGVLSDAKILAERCGYAGLHSTCVLILQDAVINYWKGNHRSALAALRAVTPVVEHLSRDYPTLPYLCYNNLACELVEMGELEEAKWQYCKLANSPFLPMYPEWQRTCADLESRLRIPSRAQVTVGEPFVPLPENVFLMPSRRNLSSLSAETAEYIPNQQRARVLNFRNEKRKVVRSRKRGFIPRPTLAGSDVLRSMTFQQKQAFALRLLLSDEVTEGELDQFLLITQQSPKTVN